MKSSIGVFDSGFGGLSILRGIVKELPEYNYIYLGDNARSPYGDRPSKIVHGFTEQAVDFLFKKNCQLVILACNTSSSEALREIQQNYLIKNHPEKRVLGVIIPASEYAVKKTRNKKIGVMATTGTVKSGTFKQEIEKLDSEIEVFQQECPLLVPLVESGDQNSEITEKALKQYISPLVKKDIDTLILGCTHYGLLGEQIKKIISETKPSSKEISIISEGNIVAKKLKGYLKRHPEIENKIEKTTKESFIPQVRQINLAKEEAFFLVIK